jgi:selenide,water dikinase
LDQVLRRLPRVENPNLLVGFETSDDAGVYKLSPECALVLTADFFTPIVDDPFTFGAIAAANALSDVYAMGGAPLTALSILCYPASGDLDDLEAILRGGAEKIHEAGAVLAGGHSVADEEIKFGYSITGTVHPARVWTNAGARPGDALVLTKPLGTGIVSTALKRGIATAEDVAASVASMLELNRAAADAARSLEVHAATDVTGFGLAGHAREMAAASRVTLVFDRSAIPLLPGAAGYAGQGAVPGGLRNNREFAGPHVRGNAPDYFFDPQTSGGLLLALPPASARRFLESYPSARTVGEVVPAGEFALEIR